MELPVDVDMYLRPAPMLLGAKGESQEGDFAF